MKKLIRITTVPVSLEKLLEGQLTFMQKEYEVIAVSSDGENLMQLGEELGIRTYAVEMSREITPLKDLKSVWDLFIFLKKEKPLIVHTHTPKAGIAGMIAAKLSGVPIRLHTVAGLPLLEEKGLRKKILIAVEKATFTCATRVYPNSKKIYDYLLKNNFTSQQKMKVLGNGSSNGIDLDYFDPALFKVEENKKLKLSLGIPEEDLVFIFVGRFVRDKGINELVRVFHNLNSELPETSLLLVGDFETKLDPLRKSTINIIKSHPKIFNVGWQNDVRPYLSCADVLTFPSYREGFPNVVMQAGAMGLPGIVTDINGCNEIIQEDFNGLLIPVKEEEQLLKAMKSMVEDYSKRIYLASNSRKLIYDKFRRQEIWKAILKEYKSLEANLNKFPLS